MSRPPRSLIVWAAGSFLLGCGGAASERVQVDAAPPQPASSALAPGAGEIPYLKLDLPKASTADFAAFVLAVQVDARGALFVEGRPATDGEVLGAATAAHARDADIRVVIQADRAASWDTVLHVVDLVKQAGVARIAFGVQASSIPPPVAVPPSSASSRAAPPPASAPPRLARPKAQSWNCPFPADADKTHTDEGYAIVSVSVGADGQPTGARLLRPAEHGFGPAALSCAFSKQYEPATDEAGKAVAGDTPPIKVRFTR